MEDSEDTPPSPLHTRPYRATTTVERVHRRPSKEGTRDYAGFTARELARLLVSKDKLTRDLEKTLHRINDQLKSEAARADDAERKAKETLVKLKSVNDARMVAQQESIRATEELNLYKLQLQSAQQEIFRAQGILDQVEVQRHEAEEAAAKARSTARKFKEERMVDMAREEGRRQGLREGLDRGRDMAYEYGRINGYTEARSTVYGEERTYGTSTAGMRSPDAMSQPMLNFDDEDQPEEVETEPETEPLPPQPAPPRPPSQPIRSVPPPVVDIRPPSPRVRSAAVPPDNFIPLVQSDNVIRLPPPHEFSQPTPSATSRLLSPTSDEEPVRFIPPPRAPSSSGAGRPESRSGRPDSRSANRRPPRARRRSSPESQSTTISQFEIVSPPSPERKPLRERERKNSGLSVIPEVLSGAASPADFDMRRPSLQDLSRGATPSQQQAGPSINVSMPSPRTAAANLREMDNQARGVEEFYHAPHASRSPSLMSDRDRRDSGNSSDTIEITIQPPSRPPSNRSLQAVSAMHHLLSPESARRQLPPISEPPQSGLLTPQQQPPLPPMQSTPSAPVQPQSPSTFVSQLPAGFIPLGPPTAAPQMGGGNPPPGRPAPFQQQYVAPSSRPYTPSASFDSQVPVGFVPNGPPVGAPQMSGVGPPGRPAAFQQQYTGPSASQQQQSPLRVGMTLTETAPVVPSFYDHPKSSKHGKKKHSKHVDDSSDTSDGESRDSVVSSGMSESSAGTLTTPPARKRKLGHKKGAPSGSSSRMGGSMLSASGVPLPPSTIAGSTYTGAGVPLPPSTIAGTPHSTVYGIYGNLGSLRNAGVTPGAMNRPLSPVTERSFGVRGFGK
ncbi:hypothetical protein JAAARDRAFT_42783 [Jaapia argillacea MUCL 33604]|uniref:Uncharacterized protein n=1 Tax=Jaapia argillacea MUCL 33604 TaxID=933084 RepID=A0A067P472_9AGAM|nr:hypothetical protein JAAARDRAFT_42783 [Jaapia argillacea MUCL 33604]